MSGRGRGVWLLRFVLAGSALVALGVLARRMPAYAQYSLRLMLAGAGVLLLAVVFGRRGRSGSAATVRRWSQRSVRQDGVASSWAIVRHGSRFAVRRKMTVLRPSLRELGFLARLRVSTLELATPVARVGWLRVWSPVEDVTLRIGGPRVGKTGELGCRILDAPGAVIATSTRTDLLETTGPVRGRRGPVWVFNPSGLGGRSSTIIFDPLSGCDEPKVAAARAADLLAGTDGPGSGSSGDREFWVGQARRVLTALLHAAALGGCSMRDVQAWVAQPEETSNKAEIFRCLRLSPEPAFEIDALQFVETNERTRTSICSTIMPALGWLTDATAAAAAGQSVGREPAVDESGVTIPDDNEESEAAGAGMGFDVQALLAESGAVYMLGAEDAQVAPLVTALTGHIARTARELAALSPGGRLDPPLTLALDEAPLICPIPLDNWTADMGGRGVTIHIAAQSRAQLRKRWGETGAAAILNNAATLMIYGGTRDPEDLQAYSTLAGERAERVETLDAKGAIASSSTQRVPVLSPAQIAQLPAGRVVIIRRSMPPAIGQVTMAWDRRDVKAAQRGQRRTVRAGKRLVARAERLTARSASKEQLALDEPSRSEVAP
jgi:type IV secretion system protein VirD4